jgi:hypothetical protein
MKNKIKEERNRGVCVWNSADLRNALKEGRKQALEEVEKKIDIQIVILRKWTDKYEKDGKLDIEVYYDDDFGNIQRVKARMKYNEKKKQIEILEELKAQIKKEMKG